MFRPRFAVLGLLWLALLASCAQPAALAPTTTPEPTATLVPTVTPSPTPAPTATPPPTLPAGSQVGGINIGGLRLDEARSLLQARLPALEPITLQAGPAELILEPTTISLTIPLDDLLAEVEPTLGASRPISLPLRLTLDQEALAAQLAELADQLTMTSTISLITSSDVLSRSFAYTHTPRLDLEAAIEQVHLALTTSLTDTIELELAKPEPTRVDLAKLRTAVAELAAEVPGVVGFHLIDLERGESVSFNGRSVFAGASTIKTAIMLYAYINRDSFDAREERWFNEMITVSDNLAANDLLAAALNRRGTEHAFTAASRMSTLLQDELGLRHTYLYVPYETTDYIRLYKPSFRCGPQGNVGQRPYTETGSCLRAEPESMARLYQMIDQCAQGEGELIERYERLNADRCQEMLDRLATNKDRTRLVAGLPKGIRAEHKSGWIEDMQADAGIVRSPGGDYAIAIYYYRPLTGGRSSWSDGVMAPVVAAFSRLAYTAYNPVILEE